MKMQEKIGIWIDKREAFIVKLSDDQVKMDKLESSIPTFNPKGGHRSKQPWGPVDTVKEKAYLAKEKQATREFFDKIFNVINGVKDLFLFGPAQTKDQLKSYLDKRHGFKPEFLKVETADSMTENQIVAEVKAAFN